MAPRTLRVATRTIPWATLAGLGLAVLVLLPSLRTGYLSDDSMNSLVRGVLRYHDISLARLIAEDVRCFLRGGRFFPFMFVLVRGTFYLFGGLPLYKAAVLAHVLVNLGTFAWLVRRTTGSATLAALSLPFVSVLLQFRASFDPILAFHGLLQFILSAVLVSVLTLHRYLEDGRRAWLVVSVGAYLLAMLTYEVSYPFFLVHLFLIACARKGARAAAKTAAPYVGAVALCVACSVAVRSLYGAHLHPAYQFHFDPGAILDTFGKQLLASVPLTYYFLGPPGPFPSRLAPLRSPPALAVAALAFPLVLALLLRLREERRALAGVGWRPLAALGLLFWVLPAVLISASPKYQQHIQRGVGYLPVYIQSFGVGLLLLAGTLFCSRLARRNVWRVPLAVGIASLVAVTGSYTYLANAAVVEFLGPVRYPRDNLEAALHAGLADGMPEGSTLLRHNTYYAWHCHYTCYSLAGARNWGDYFYYLHSGKRLHTVALWPPDREEGPDDSGCARACRDALGRPGVYEVRDVPTGAGEGHVFLMKLDTPALARDGAPPARTTREVRLFVRGKGLARGATPPSLFLAGRYAGGGHAGEGAGDDFHTDPAALTVLRRGKGWALYSFVPDGRVLADSLHLTYRPGP